MCVHVSVFLQHYRYIKTRLWNALTNTCLYTHMLSVLNYAWVCLCALLCVTVLCVFLLHVCIHVASVHVCVCVCSIRTLALSRGQRLLWSPLMDAQLESGTHKGSQGHSHCLSGPHHLAELCTVQFASLSVFMCILCTLCLILDVCVLWKKGTREHLELIATHFPLTHTHG